MKTLKLFSMVIMTILIGIGITSCSSDDDNNTLEEIYGIWSGSDDDNYRHVTAIFNRDKTGQVEISSSFSTKTNYFTYEVSGKNIICKGKGVNSDVTGSVDTYDYEETYTYDGTYVITGNWNHIKLSKQ